MKASRQSKEKKEKTVNFYLFNINLKSGTRHGSQAYADIFETLQEKKIVYWVSPDSALIMLKPFARLLDDEKVYYGTFTRYLGAGTGGYFNERTKEITHPVELRDEKQVISETDYVFIPSIHRLAVVKKSKITINQLLMYLDSAFANTVKEPEQFHVTIEQTQDIFNEIFTAQQVKYLKIKVTYSNNDINKGSVQVMDSLLRESNIGEIDATIKPDANQEIDVKSQLVNGLIGLAQSNGKVEATIKNSHQRPKKIKTIEHPEILSATHESEDGYWLSIIQRAKSYINRNKDESRRD